MAETMKLQRRWALITGLRALLMLLAGLYAIIWPAEALLVLVVMGGALFLVDGVLGLWSLTFGGAKTGNFWFDVARNVLGIITGVLILLSPMLATRRPASPEAGQARSRKSLPPPGSLLLHAGAHCPGMRSA